MGSGGASKWGEEILGSLLGRRILGVQFFVAKDAYGAAGEAYCWL